MHEEDTLSKVYDAAQLDEENDDDEEEHKEAMGEIIPVSWYLEREKQRDAILT